MLKILRDKRIAVIPYILATSLSYVLSTLGLLATMYFNRTLVAYAEGSLAGFSWITLLVFILLIIIIQLGITNFFSNYLTQKLLLKNLRKIIGSLFEKSTTMPISDYEEQDKSKIINHYLVDGAKASEAIINVVGVGLGLTTSIIALLTVNFITSATVTLYSLLLFIPFIAITILGSRKLEKTSYELAIENDSALSVVKNYTSNKENICISEKEEYFKEDLNRTLEGLKEKRISNVFWQKIAYEMPNIIIGLTPILVLVIAIMFTGRDSLRFSEIYFMTSIMTFIYEPLGQLVVLLIRWKESMPFINRLLEFLNAESDVEEAYSEIYTGKAGFLRGSGNVHGIDGRDLYDFEMELPERGFLILKGPNGSGKSTFFKLISKMMDPSLVKNSSFKINSKYERDIGVLFYPLFVFSGTVSENINYDSGLDENKLDLFTLPNLDKTVVPDPVNLSSGEQQKISLLRLFHQDKSVYLLDEPTSNLEQEAITSLKEYINKLKNDKLIIAIMHDDSYDDISDGFIMIEDGKLKMAI